MFNASFMGRKKFFTQRAGLFLITFNIWQLAYSVNFLVSKLDAFPFWNGNKHNIKTVNGQEKILIKVGGT